MPEPSKNESPAERLDRYRKLSAQANDMAEKSYSRELRDAYTALAASWLALALDLERAIQEGKDTRTGD
jgi:hypothetical protein